MKQQQTFLPGSHSLQRPSQPPPAWLHWFWGFFWGGASWMLLPQLFWLVPTLMYAWWHIPFYFPLPILLVGYIALLIAMIRLYRRFKRATSSSRLQDEQQEFRDDQTQTSEAIHSDFAEPQPLSQYNEQFQVSYPEQE